MVVICGRKLKIRPCESTLPLGLFQWLWVAMVACGLLLELRVWEAKWSKERKRNHNCHHVLVPGPLLWLSYFMPPCEVVISNSN